MSIWREWSLDPGIALPLAISGGLYLRGARASRGLTRAQVACFWSGWAVLLCALLSPLHEFGEQLFWAHMVQHEILMLIAAPLLVLSRPLVPLLWGMPLTWRRAAGRAAKVRIVHRAWHFLTEPFTAWCVHAAALWIWHAPYLFQATLRSEWVHAAQHSSFFLSALFFWWSLFHASGRLGYGAAVVYVFTTAIHTSILGALLTFAPYVLYPAYNATAPRWGWSALEDQQTGGLIMWVPAGLVYLGVGLALFAAWLRESDAMLERRRYAD